MQKIDLSTALAVRVANQEALAIRISNIEVWTAPESIEYVERSIFNNIPPSGDFIATYSVERTLGENGWIGNIFYIDNPAYTNWKVSGLRLWVPDNSEVIGKSVKISAHCQPAESGLEDWGAISSGAVISSIESFPGLKTFPSGTLQAQWNTLLFDTAFDLPLFAYIALAVSIDDGSYLLKGSPLIWNYSSYPSKDVRMALSGEDGQRHRGIYKYSNGVTEWSSDHYGIDIIALQPAHQARDRHSIWDNTTVESSVYGGYTGLDPDGWTATCFYATTHVTGWQLTGAKLFIEPGSYNVGLPARCSYHIKPNGRVTTDDSPEDILTSIAANDSRAEITVLTTGWNEVLFSEPIEIPPGAGIVIGWQIGDGDNYTSTQLNDASIPARDGSPFALASSNQALTERRSLYKGYGGYSWGYANSHYGGDLLLKAPQP